MKNRGLLRSALSTVALIVLVVSAQAREGEHDETYPVASGARLVVEQTIGSLVIVGWDRDEIRVEADFDPEDLELDVRDRGLRFLVQLVGKRGLQGYGELELRVPRWIPIDIEGHEVDVEVEGVDAEIEVDLVGGDVFVQGGKGVVNVKSVHGGIEIHDAEADFDLGSTHEDIELRDCEGDVRIESVNGDVRMEGMKTGRLEIETTQGDVLLDGTLDAEGDYFISTHAGDVAVSIPPDADMSITMETYHGDVQSGVGAELEELRRGKRYRLVLGDGRGRMVIESFQGDITLYDPKGGRRKRG